MNPMSNTPGGLIAALAVLFQRVPLKVRAGIYEIVLILGFLATAAILLLPYAHTLGFTIPDRQVGILTGALTMLAGLARSNVSQTALDIPPGFNDYLWSGPVVGGASTVNEARVAQSAPVLSGSGDTGDTGQETSSLPVSEPTVAPAADAPAALPPVTSEDPTGPTMLGVPSVVTSPVVVPQFPPVAPEAVGLTAVGGSSSSTVVPVAAAPAAPAAPLGAPPIVNPSADL